MQVTTDDGVALWAASSGQGGRPAIAFDGGGVWDYLASLSNVLDGLLATMRFDQRGCGRSGGADGPFTLARAVADVEAVRRAAGADRPVLIGHSWGATLALLCALEHPQRVAGVVYVAGIGIEWERWKHLHWPAARARLGDDTADRVEALFSRQRTEAEEREYLLLTWSADHPDGAVGRERAAALLEDGLPLNYRANHELNGEMRRLEGDALAARCRGLAVPFLVIEGRLDPRPNAAVDSLVAALPRVTRHTVNGAGHFPWLDSPEEFRAAIAEWLAAVP
jgi:proline iminopeptidase